MQTARSEINSQRDVAKEHHCRKDGDLGKRNLIVCRSDIYIDIGKSAGQFDSSWQRRIKIPLETISWEMIDSVLEKPKRLLQATIPGTGKDGGPSCATVKPIDGWNVVK